MKTTDPAVPGPGTYVPKNLTVANMEGRTFNFQGRTQCFNGKCKPKTDNSSTSKHMFNQTYFSVTDPELIT